MRPVGDKVGKKGVVREAATHLEVVERVIGMAIENGFSVLGLEFSPVKGPEGNIEYLLYVEKSEAPAVAPEVDPAALVVAPMRHWYDYFCFSLY